MQKAMLRKRKLFWAKTGVILAAVPFLLWAVEYGPDPGYSGVPSEHGGQTCGNSSCHNTKDNQFSGSVTVTFPGVQQYTPGVKQHLLVTIADPAQQAWGFQLTARQSNNSGTMAGSFTPTDTHTLLMCSQTDLNTLRALCLPGGDAGAQGTCDASPAPVCPSGFPLQYVEHSAAGYFSTRRQPASATYEFDWTPPSSAVGDITIFVAGNAANGDLTQNGDHIYTKTYTLTAASAGGGNAPTINSSNGVQSASGFGGFPAVAPGTWIEIFGANFASGTRPWSGSDFNGVNAPTSLDGTKVAIGGQSAFVYFISPTQVNAQVPSNVATGTQQVTVSTAGGTSNSFPVTVNALQPGLLSPPSFNLNNKQYVVAQLCEPGKTCSTLNDLTFVLPAGSLAGSGFLVRPAKPGENLTIYGIGFGPVIDSSNLNIPAGQVVAATNQLVNSVQMQVNGVNANLTYAGLAPGQVGVYQFNLVVPAVPDGDWPLTFTQNGVKGTQSLLLSVHQ
jgi:uncharacterized protein (TIGR03437 family)